jgi:flagellar biosynthesis regulator FlaF
MTCPEREQLLQAYHQAVSAYANAVSELKYANRDQFPRQFALADAARQKCDRLREKIDQHRVTHGC